MSESAGQDSAAVDRPTQEEFVAWVQEFLSRLESVDRASNRHWCPQWWAHTEAVDRLATLHAQWLVAMEENTMSSWWVDHFDRHATVLFSPQGPFGECGVSHVEKGARRTLTTEQPPAEWSW